MKKLFLTGAAALCALLVLAGCGKTKAGKVTAENMEEKIQNIGAQVEGAMDGLQTKLAALDLQLAGGDVGDIQKQVEQAKQAVAPLQDFPQIEGQEAVVEQLHKSAAYYEEGFAALDALLEENKDKIGQASFEEVLTYQGKLAQVYEAFGKGQALLYLYR